jgi:Pyruvate/2-oxoacid:ferredoxin oxidoreductase delta subunit
VSALSSPALRMVLYEGDGSKPLDAKDRAGLLHGLLDKGYPVSSVRQGEVDAPGDSLVFVMGRFVGPAPSSTTGGATDRVRFHELLEGDVASNLAAVLAAADALRVEANLAVPGKWKPWFPVIDYARCTNCMQCLSFCLFDVYGVSSAKKIEVRNQDNCKTDCPACSRVCPEVAIMFPKYKHGPINGDEVSVEDMRREAMKIDISALLGGDIYSMLRERTAKAKSRFSKERDDQRALLERQKCLMKLQKDLGIPSEVLAALPTAEEIQAKAEQAMARAREALKG